MGERLNRQNGSTGRAPAPPRDDAALGIDFGTSNSAAGYMVDGVPRLVEMAPGRTTLPSAFFFDAETRETLIGDPANEALLDGAEGRFMRALKRVLGTDLMHEERTILGRRITFVDIIGDFLRVLRERAEADAGRPFRRVLSGRPVVFHRASDPREGQAQDDLAACYRAAGFNEIGFMAEPEAAAIADGTGVGARAGTIGLIVDIGGGTSDFSVFRTEEDGATILASYGVRIGGTDFDRAISIDRAMPLLGRGAELRRLMGPGTTTTPNAIYNDLATWELIPFVYTPQNRRMAEEMRRLAVEPQRLARLAEVLEERLGHDIAFAVERGKIDANGGAASAAIDLDAVETGLSGPLDRHHLSRTLDPMSRSLKEGARTTLDHAGIAPELIDRVVYVGGSSLMSAVPDAMRTVLPDAQHSVADVFTAVTDGLARAASRRQAS